MCLCVYVSGFLLVDRPQSTSVPQRDKQPHEQQRHHFNKVANQMLKRKGELFVLLDGTHGYFWVAFENLIL